MTKGSNVHGKEYVQEHSCGTSTS